MESKIFNDGKGKLSSKRISGISMLAMAGIMSAILFGYSIATKIGDPETAITLIQGFLVTGGALLGVGVFEKFGKK